MDDRPIGIFDSGVGGLTVVSQIIKNLPNEQIIYFGDTARVPYGSKSKETVTKFSRQIVRFLLTKDVKTIIIACNTVSSNSLDIISSEFSIPVMGVVIPGVEAVIETTKNNVVGIIGTDSTIKSNSYESFIHKKNPNIIVHSKACPLFVPLAEEGWIDNDIAYLTAQAYLTPLMDYGIDSLLFGCTHYPLLRFCIERTVGKRINLIDPAEKTAEMISIFLKKNNSLRESQIKPENIFYVSDNTQKFELISKKALNKIYEAIKIDIEQY